jgi:hypothetical protein
MQVATELAKCFMVVDNFHYDTNHTGKYCALNCSPHNHPIIKDANTNVCEQRFRWLNKYKNSFRHMKRAWFNFMLLLLTHKYNKLHYGQ